jgi:hypothetical protein
MGELWGGEDEALWRGEDKEEEEEGWEDVEGDREDEAEDEEGERV